ncbi:MAG: type II toxin-antitoxin system ParD family antitoxin [Planctomycetes bacterium]|nr:type II toxin-antitoxin system ParD family antitoxin [Planctomycetota bacterium]
MHPDREDTFLILSLSMSQREFVEIEASRSGCATTGEYLRRLIRAEEERASAAELERKLIVGLESGDALEMTPAHWEQKRRDLVERLGRRQP